MARAILPLAPDERVHPLHGQSHPDALAEPDALTVAALLIDTLAPRTDTYNRWTGSRTAGHWQRAQTHAPDCANRSGCPCPDAPLTPAVIVDAYGMRTGISALHPGADGATHVGVIDCDRDDDGTTVARQVAAELARRGVPAYTELSQAQRAHVWVIGPRLPAIVWQYAMLATCAAVGYPGATSGELLRAHRIEVRPDGTGGRGAGMRMPGLYHPKTGQRYPMLDPDGADMGIRPAEWLPRLDLAPADALVALAELHTPPAPPQPVRRSRELRAFDDDTGATEVLTGLYGVVNAAPGRSVRCPLHDDRHASLSILKDDRRVICRAAGCPGNGPKGTGLWPSELALLAGGRA